MAGGAEKITQGPMAANDALVASWIGNLSLFEEQGRELVVTNFRFQTAGQQRVAIIIPKGGELDLITVLPGEKVIKIEGANGVAHANPTILTGEQEKQLIATKRVRMVQFQLSPRDLRELDKTVKAND